MNPVALLGRPLVSFASGATKVTCDGNSLTAGSGVSAGQAYPAVLATLAPVSTFSTPVANIGIGGQQASGMTSSRSDVTAAFDAGRVNVLVAWELTNSLYFGATAQQAVTDLLTYVSTIKASQNWKVAVVTAVPRYQKRSADAAFTQTEVDAYNAVIIAANTLLRAQWRGTANHLIDLCAVGSPFVFANYLPASFTGSGMYLDESADGGTIRTHLSATGYAAVAAQVAVGLLHMPKR